MQELRVAQTGVQVLFAFLLTIAFQSRFADLGRAERTVYVVVLLCCAVAATLLIAPVATHRMLFRQHRKDDVVLLSARLAAMGLCFLAFAVLGATLLVLSIVVGWIVAGMLTCALAVIVAVSWVWIPIHLRPTRKNRA